MIFKTISRFEFWSKINISSAVNSDEKTNFFLRKAPASFLTNQNQEMIEGYLRTEELNGLTFKNLNRIFKKKDIYHCSQPTTLRVLIQC